MRAIPSLAERKPPPSDADRVVRKATRDDIVTRLKHQQREQDAQRICLMKIRERGLAMKLARVEQIFDGSRLIFYYTAEGRVDFRELVRDLAAHFRARIEMRQIGVRDEAKMLGGYGSCGRPLCCTTWLQSFEPVSIKMAKQQKLSLNPSKLSGMCGRLKCCLRYELPNGKGVKHGGCADEGGCGSCDNPTGPGGGLRLLRERRLRELRSLDCCVCRRRRPSASPSAIRPASARRSRARRRRTRGSSMSARRCSTVRQPTQSFAIGRVSAAAGQAAYDAIVAAVEDARQGRIAAIATAPINKEAFAAARVPWRGHTELLAHLTGTPPRRDDVLLRRPARRAGDGAHPAGGGPARADPREPGRDDCADGVRAAAIWLAVAAARARRPEPARGRARPDGARRRGGAGAGGRGQPRARHHDRRAACRPTPSSFGRCAAISTR